MSSEFWIDRGRGPEGPHDAHSLRALAADGRVGPDDQVSRDRDKWVSASQVRGLEFGPAEDDAMVESAEQKSELDSESGSWDDDQLVSDDVLSIVKSASVVAKPDKRRKKKKKKRNSPGQSSDTSAARTGDFGEDKLNRVLLSQPAGDATQFLIPSLLAVGGLAIQCAVLFSQQHAPGIFAILLQNVVLVCLAVPGGLLVFWQLNRMMETGFEPVPFAARIAGIMVADLGVACVTLYAGAELFSTGGYLAPNAANAVLVTTVIVCAFCRFGLMMWLFDLDSLEMAVFVGISIGISFAIFYALSLLTAVVIIPAHFVG